MENDIISALMQEVKEEVIEKYFYERRLMEEQINYVRELAQCTAKLQENLFRRFDRICELLLETRFITQFVGFLGLKTFFLFQRVGREGVFREGLRFISVRSLTERGRYRKLLLESYRRLFLWNKRYSNSHANFKRECEGVNYNLKKFEQNYDLLIIINFLKDMDVEATGKKYFLGDNFTPAETATLDKTLRFKTMVTEEYNLIPPPRLPKPEEIKDELLTLADCVYSECCHKIKSLIQ